MKSWFKKQMAVLLTLVLAFSVTIPVSAEGTDESVQTVTVTLSGQAYNGFFFAPGEYTIPSNEAEKFGYKDTAGGVTTLDALVYAHELAFKEDYTPETKDTYLKVEGSSIETMFGAETSNVSFAVNGEVPNDGTVDEKYNMWAVMYTVDNAILKNYDKVEYFVYQDQDLCSDDYAWFAQNGKRKDKIVSREGQPLELSVEGYMFMWTFYPESMRKSHVEGIEDAQLSLVDEKGGLTKLDVKTDSNGEVTINGLKSGNYYLSASIEDEDSPMVMPICKLQIVPDMAERIASNYTQADDAWTMLEMVQAGYRNRLTKIDDYVASAAVAINSSEDAGEIAKSIIALNALGYDVKNMNIDKAKVNALEKLEERNILSLSSSSPVMFALIAVDAGIFEISSEKCTREALVKKLLSLQTKDYGWTWKPLSVDPEADIDMTGMALAAFAPYYLASDAKTSGLTEDTYNSVKSAVDAAIDTLSKKQGANGSYGNTDTDAWVIVGLSSIGIDANANEKFIKNGHGLYDGMFEYVLDDFSGFGWTNNKELNAFATNDAFRALIAYSNMKATGKAYNVYASDSSKATTPIIANTKTITVGENFTVDTDILLENVTNKEVTYRTTNESMAEVTTQGVVTAKKSGTVVIVATSKEDETRKVLYYVTIKDKPKDSKPTTEPSSEPKKDDPTEATTEVNTEATTEAPAKVNYSKIPLQTGKKTNVIQINGGKTKIKKAKVNNKKIVSVTVKNGKLQIKAKKKGK
ncbi:MAG: Ig-like domain-containing protein, partial [Clostridium sp.]|nr:Ig-like domain-containing protein [Clostridium sp.]